MPAKKRSTLKTVGLPLLGVLLVTVGIGVVTAPDEESTRREPVTNTDR